MRRDGYIFFCLLICACFTTGPRVVRAAGDLAELEDLARRIGVQSQRVTDTLSRVHVMGKAYDIYYHDTRDVDNAVGYHANTLSKLYVCTSCVFASWTRGELFDFVAYFPVLYSRKFAGTHNDVFRAAYAGKTGPALRRIARHTHRFVDVLLNFAETVGYTSLVDTALTRALLSLNLEIEYLRSVCDRPYATAAAAADDDDDDDDDAYSDAGLDVHVVQSLVEAIGDVQTFMAVNCPVSDHYADNLFFYYPEPATTDGTRVTDFLDGVGPMRLELADGGRCDVSESLLTNVLDKWAYADTSVLRGILFLKYDVGCDEELWFYDVYDVVGPFRDLQTVHWYQRVVANTVVSLLFAKIRSFLAAYRVGARVPIVAQAFRTINATFLAAYNGDLPANVAEGFELLASKDAYDRADVDRLNDTIPRSSLAPAAEVFPESYGPGEENEEILTTLLRSSLEDVLRDMLRNAEQFTCFVRLFKFLNAEYDTYYTPFNKDYNKIVDTILASEMCRWKDERPVAEKKRQLLKRNFRGDLARVNVEFAVKDGADYVGAETNDPSDAGGARVVSGKDADDIDLSAEGCDFFTGLIHQCAVVLDRINGSPTPGLEDDLNPSTFVRDRLNVIRSALHTAHTGYSNRRLHRTAYNLLPIIDVNFEHGSGGTGKNHQLRIMSLLAVELNHYGLEYCRPPKHNFLQFNNVSVDALGNVSFYENAIRRFVETIQNAKMLDRQHNTKLGRFQFMGLDGIYAEYSKNAHYYGLYVNVIQFRWKGEDKSIGDIYNNLVNHISQPFYYYAFADILLKFSVATLFIEVDGLKKRENFELNATDVIRYLELLQTVRKAVQLTKSHIKKLADDIVDEMQTIYFLGIQKKDYESKLNALSEKIKDKFKANGVSIDFSQPKIKSNEFPQAKSASNVSESQNLPQNMSLEIEELVTPIRYITKTITLIAEAMNEYVAYIV